MKNIKQKLVVITHNGQNTCTYLMTPEAYDVWRCQLSTGDFHCHQHHFINSSQKDGVLDLNDLLEMEWVS